MNLNDYINDIEKIYKNAREEYTPTAERLERLEESHKNAIHSGELSPKGLERETERYNENKKVYQNTLKEIRDKFLKDCGKVKGIVSDTFRDNYEVNPKYIDRDTVTLLNSGILRESELTALCEKNNNNITMVRLIGSYINDPKTELGKYYKRNSEIPKDREDLKIIDQVATLYNKGLQDDIKYANRYNRTIDNILTDTRKAAAKIVSNKSPLLDE